MEKTYKGQTDLSKYDNRWYKQPPAWKVALWMLCSALFLKTYLPIPIALKRFILRFFGAKMGKNITIKPSVTIKYPWLLSVGDYTWIGENVWIDNLVEVNIGRNVCLSQGAMLLTGNHNYSKSTFDLMVGTIVLEDGVWIGAKSIVSPGIRCYSHAVLSVNSVASQNLDAYSIYRGNPAERIKERRIEA